MDPLGGRDGGVHPEPPAAQLDDSHAHVSGHIAEAQGLLLLKHPYAAALHLENEMEKLQKCLRAAVFRKGSSERDQKCLVIQVASNTTLWKPPQSSEDHQEAAES